MESETPFSKHLNTSYIPTTLEITQLKAPIAARRDAVKEIDEEIENLFNWSKVLRATRQAHMKYIGDHYCLMAPIRRLPVEVLSAIFELLCPPKWPDLQHPLNETLAILTRQPRLPSPVILSHVCHRWREVSLHTPALWAAISLSLPADPAFPSGHRNYPQALQSNVSSEWSDHHEQSIAKWKECVGGLKEMMAQCITRSDGRPLFLQFKANDSQNSETTLTEFVQLLTAVSHRWKVVSFLLHIRNSTSPLHQLLRLSPENVPLLCKFSLERNMHEDPPSTFTVQVPTISGIKLIKGPLVRELALSLTRSDARLVTANWDKLTELFMLEPVYGIDMLKPANALELLQKCPRLVRCGFYMENTTIAVPGDDAIVPRDPTIDLPYLTSFSIRCSSIPKGFAASLDLPLLRSISMMSYIMIPQDVGESGLVEWIQLFGPQLVDVAFTYGCLTQPALQFVMENLPNMVSLKLMGLDIGQRPPPGVLRGGAQLKPAAVLTSGILERMTPRASGEGFGSTMCACPKLEVFKCKLGREEYVEKAMLEFIVAKRGMVGAGLAPGVARIRDLRVMFDITPQVSIYEEMSKRKIDMEDFVAVLSYKVPGLASQTPSEAHWRPELVMQLVVDFADDRLDL